MAWARHSVLAVACAVGSLGNAGAFFSPAFFSSASSRLPQKSHSHPGNTVRPPFLQLRSRVRCATKGASLATKGASLDEDCGMRLEFTADVLGRHRLKFREKGWNSWSFTPRPSGFETSDDEGISSNEVPSEASGSEKVLAPGSQTGISADGKTYQINYISHGTTGTPVVLVHGFGASAFHWRYQIAELAKTHRVYSL